MTTKTRQKYRFTLNFPTAFTAQQLLRAKRGTVQYITIHKRIEGALASGTLKEVGKFRKKAQKGRMQKVYVLANVTNVMVELENAQLTKGDLVLA